MAEKVLAGMLEGSVTYSMSPLLLILFFFSYSVAAVFTLAGLPSAEEDLV